MDSAKPLREIFNTTDITENQWFLKLGAFSNTQARKDLRLPDLPAFI